MMCDLVDLCIHARLEKVCDLSPYMMRTVRIINGALEWQPFLDRGWGASFL